MFLHKELIVSCALMTEFILSTIRLDRWIILGHSQWLVQSSFEIMLALTSVPKGIVVSFPSVSNEVDRVPTFNIFCLLQFFCLWTAERPEQTHHQLHFTNQQWCRRRSQISESSFNIWNVAKTSRLFIKIFKVNILYGENPPY